MKRPGGAPLLAATLSAALLAGCASDGSYVGPDFPFLPGYRGATGSPVLLDNLAWWTRLQDPVLDRLVARALSGTPTLAAAQARVEAARAARDGLPHAAIVSSQVGLRVEGTEAGSDRTAPLRFGLDWILDPYGVRRDRLRAAEARVDAAEAESDAARLLLLSNLATAYVDLRYEEERLALARRELGARQRTAGLIDTLLNQGEATRLEEVRAQARVAELRAELPALQTAPQATRNEIAVLIGLAPGALPPDLAAALQGSGQPLPTLSPEVGIPADLLRNRPDIRVAERRYAAALAELDAAEAARYPSLSLSGAITLDLLGGGLGYFLGPALQLPDISGNNGRAGAAQARAAVHLAHAEWQQAVLGALLEVENALLAYDAATTAAGAAQRALSLYRETVALTRNLYETGEVALGDLIDAELAVAEAERRLAELRRQRAQSFVELNIRLGAGHRVGG